MKSKERLFSKKEKIFYICVAFLLVCSIITIELTGEGEDTFFGFLKESWRVFGENSIWDFILGTRVNEENFINFCIESNGTYNDQECTIGYEESTRYSIGILCKGYLVSVHSNESVDIQLPTKLEKECFIVKEDRGD